MAKFIVELQKTAPKYTNAFRASGMNMAQTVSINIRKWEVEAEDVLQVQAFFAEAVNENHPNVRGYKIRSIVQVGL